MMPFKIAGTIAMLLLLMPINESKMDRASDLFAVFLWSLALYAMWVPA